MENMVIEITDENFEEEVINSKIPVMVDFYARWCGPCKNLIPILESLNKEYKDKLKIVKMNVETNSTAQRYKVSSLPSLLLFKNGEPIERCIGLKNEKSLKESILKGIDNE